MLPGPIGAFGFCRELRPEGRRAAGCAGGASTLPATIDLAARALDNSVQEVLGIVRKVAEISLDDGLEFESDGSTAEVIREEDDHSGVRVTLGGRLSRAVIRLHVDVSVRDPIWPEPRQVSLPRLLEGTLVVRGYPLEMVLAEKIVTAIARGTANTRWRDFVDIYAVGIARKRVSSRGVIEAFTDVATRRKDQPLLRIRNRRELVDGTAACLGSHPACNTMRFRTNPLSRSANIQDDPFAR